MCIGILNSGNCIWCWNPIYKSNQFYHYLFSFSYIFSVPFYLKELRTFLQIDCSWFVNTHEPWSCFTNLNRTCQSTAAVSFEKASHLSDEGKFWGWFTLKLINETMPCVQEIWGFSKVTPPPISHDRFPSNCFSFLVNGLLVWSSVSNHCLLLICCFLLVFNCFGNLSLDSFIGRDS